MSKPRRCVALLSGGLDSMLVIRIMQAQGIEVEALNFKTVSRVAKINPPKQHATWVCE